MSSHTTPVSRDAPAPHVSEKLAKALRIFIGEFVGTDTSLLHEQEDGTWTFQWPNSTQVSDPAYRSLPWRLDVAGIVGSEFEEQFIEAQITNALDTAFAGKSIEFFIRNLELKRDEACAHFTVTIRYT